MPSPPAHLRHAARLGLGMAASRCLGLFRDVLMASLLGGGLICDAFLLAFRLPNLVRRFAAEGNLSSCLVPAYLVQRQTDQAKSTRFFHAFLVLSTGSGCLLALLVILAGHPLAAAMAPGWAGENVQSQSVRLLAVMAAYLPLCFAAATCCGALIACQSFSLPSLFSATFNAVLILLCLILLIHGPDPMEAALWLAVGVVAAGAAQALLCGAALPGIGLSPLGRVKRADLLAALPTLRATPAAGLAGAGHMIGMLILAAMASFHPAGSVSALYFAERLLELPLGILGAALAMAVQPSLARKSESLDKTVALDSLSRTLRLCLFLAIPAALGLVLVSGVLTSALFGHGGFAASTLAMTGDCVRAFALALPALALIRILSAGMSARNLPGLGAVSMVQNGSLLLAGLCLLPLGSAGSLALAFPLSAWIALIWMLIRPARSLMPAMASSYPWSARLALVAMASIVWFSLRLDLSPIPQALLSMSLGASVYLGMAFALRNQEARELASLFCSDT